MIAVLCGAWDGNDDVGDLVCGDCAGEVVGGGFSTTTDVDTVSDSLSSFAVLIVVLSDVGVEKVMVSF